MTTKARATARWKRQTVKTTTKRRRQTATTPENVVVGKSGRPIKVNPKELRSLLKRGDLTREAIAKKLHVSPNCVYATIKREGIRA